jgi:hypothetical protein
MNKNPKFEHLTQYKWKPGQSGNSLGRPKAYQTILKELGYTQPVIAVITAEIAFLPYPQVEELAYSKTEPILKRIIAEAFRSACYDGEYKFIEPYMKILFGRTVPYIPEQENKGNENS